MTIIALVSWGMMIMSWHFYASFTVMIWTVPCKHWFTEFNTVSWNFENKVGWHSCMHSIECYSHILIITMTSEKECVIIRLQNQGNHNIGWQLTQISFRLCIFNEFANGEN